MSSVTCVVCFELPCEAVCEFCQFPGGTFTPSRSQEKGVITFSDDMSSVKVPSRALHSHVFPTDARGAVRGSGARYPCRVSGCPISMQTTWCS